MAGIIPEECPVIKPEPKAYLMTGGRTYADRVVRTLEQATEGMKTRTHDGSRLEPLYGPEVLEEADRLDTLLVALLLSGELNQRQIDMINRARHPEREEKKS